jgi:integrase
MRHTYAVRILEQSPEGRDDIGRHMLALSTCMGHSNVADTYWYLEATPHLLRDIASTCESFVETGGKS